MHIRPIEDVKKQVQDAAEELQKAIKQAVGEFELDMYSGLAGDVRIYERWVIAQVIKSLEDAREIATMDRAQFGGIRWLYDEIAPGSGVKLTPEQREAALVLFGEKADPSDFIRHLTRLWRDAWIICPLENAIEVLKTAQHKC